MQTHLISMTSSSWPSLTFNFVLKYIMKYVLNESEFSFNNWFQNTMTEETIPSCIKATKCPCRFEGIRVAQRKEAKEDAGAGQKKINPLRKGLGLKTKSKHILGKGQTVFHTVCGQLPQTPALPVTEHVCVLLCTLPRLSQNPSLPPVTLGAHI